MTILYMQVGMGILPIKEDSKTSDNKVRSPVPLESRSFSYCKLLEDHFSNIIQSFFLTRIASMEFILKKQI